MKSIINFLLFLAMFCASSHGQAKNYFLSYNFFLNKGVNECGRKECRKLEHYVVILQKKNSRKITFVNKDDKCSSISYNISTQSNVTVFSRKRSYAGFCYTDSIFLFNDKYFVYSKTIMGCNTEFLLTDPKAFKSIRKDYWIFSDMDTAISVCRYKTNLDNTLKKNISIEDGLPDDNEWYGNLDIDSLQIIRKNTYPQKDSPVGYSAFFNKDLENKSFLFDLLFWILTEADY